MAMPIAETERGHRRGVVLGFTMAELLMLLLFCLLLVTATTFLKKDEEIEALKQLTSTTSPNLAAEALGKAVQLDRLLTLLFPAGNGPKTPADFDKVWETVVLSRSQSQQIGEAGADVESLLTVLRDVKSKAATQEDLNRLIAVLDQLVRSGATQLSEAELTQLIQQVNARTASGTEDPSGHRWPPIISLDGNKYRFRTGSAEITPEFQTYLANEASNKIAALLKQYEADVVEIVGHTDEQVIEPTEETVSNLDKVAIDAVNGRTEQELIPVDNAGLGLARAIEVARVLRQQTALREIKIVPLSAGQLLRRGDLLSSGGETANDPDRRRIEIRVRRSTPATE